MYLGACKVSLESVHMRLRTEPVSVAILGFLDFDDFDMKSILYDSGIVRIEFYADNYAYIEIIKHDFR